MKISKKVLERLYWKEKKALTEIAKIFKVHHEKIRRLMKKYGIPIRSRLEGILLKKKLKVGKKKLYELYWKKGMKLEDIGKLFGVSAQTVRRALQKYGIRRRTYSEARAIQRRKISSKELKTLYLSRKMSLKKLARYIGTRPSTVREMLIKRGIKLRRHGEALIKYKRRPFSGSEIEKNYLIGFSVGDLYVVKSNRTIVVRVTSTHPSMITLFCKLFSKYGYCKKRPRKSKLGYGYQWEVTCYLDESFSFLLVDKNSLTVPTKKKMFLSFLAGYSDAEGCWKMVKRKKGYIEFRFDLETQDVGILEQIATNLKQYGFTPKLHRVKRKGKKIGCFVLKKDMYRLSLCKRKEVIRLGMLLLPFVKHSEKKRKIELLIAAKNKKRYEEIKNKLIKLKNQIRKEVLKCVEEARIAYLKKSR